MVDDTRRPKSYDCSERTHGRKKVEEAKQSLEIMVGLSSLPLYLHFTTTNSTAIVFSLFLAPLPKRMPGFGPRLYDVRG